MKYDAVVAGAGIAGIASAEILARNGLKVLIFDTNEKFCSYSSSQQHGWYHLGSLYSIFPNSDYLKSMLISLENLIKNYKCFDGMNIEIKRNGELNFKKKKNGWINDQRIKYIVASRNDQDFKNKKIKDIFKILNWEKKIKKFISRHGRYENHNWKKSKASEFIPKANLLDYRKKFIKKPNINELTLDKDTHFMMEGYDRTMKSYNIANDLFSSFLKNKGKFYVGTKFINSKKIKNDFEINTNKGKFYCKYFINATGYNLRKNNSKQFRVKSVYSPIAVFYPPLSKKNFVRLTPNKCKTINHLSHTTEKNKEYSVVGCGMDANKKNKKKVEKKLIDLCKLNFKNYKKSNLVGIYSGLKTEYVKEKGNRHYGYKIYEKEKNHYLIVPGKFTLCFSLASEIMKKILGKSKSDNRKVYKSLKNKVISFPLHYNLISKNI